MMHLTPEICERTYELLRVTPPFKKWRLPEADEVEFRVTASRTSYGKCGIRHGAHMIAIAQPYHQDLTTLLQTMAHEMIHLQQHRRNIWREKNGNHGPVFQRDARRVCYENRWYLKF